MFFSTVAVDCMFACFSVSFGFMHASEAAALSRDIIGDILFPLAASSFAVVFPFTGLDLVVVFFASAVTVDLAARFDFFPPRPGEDRALADIDSIAVAFGPAFVAAVPIVAFDTVVSDDFVGILLRFLVAPPRKDDRAEFFVAFLAFAAALNPRVIVALTRLSKT